MADAAGEGVDKPCLKLDCGAPPIAGVSLKRDELVKRVAAANPRTIVVLETAGPVLTPWRASVKGIVEAWYAGQAAGPAIARVLFGDVDPGGRLPATFPRREGDLPTAGDRSATPASTTSFTTAKGCWWATAGGTERSSGRPSRSEPASPTPRSPSAT